MKIITKSIRKLFSDKTDTFVFNQCIESDFILNPKKEFGLYIHIPFCRSLCPYCPYNKMFFDETLAKEYVDAICKEIKLVVEKIGRQKFDSLYIGGGTPTLLMPGLKKVIDEIHNCFVLNGPVAVETTPSDFNENKIKEMKKIGATYLSLGVQSFRQKYLSFLGRNHDAAMTKEAVSLLRNKDFKIANIDLIFAYPEQTLDELLEDLEQTVLFYPEQVTCYQLFTFPYSKVGQFLKIKEVKMPNWKIRQKMYYAIVDFFTRKGYCQSSVWSFSQNQNYKYSSVTRDYYIGFGAGAASYTGTGFYFNTFSVPEYISTAKSRIPVALKMEVSKKLERLFWLYWRFYDTKIPIAKYKESFGQPLFGDFGNELRLFKALGFFENRNDNIMSLSKRGAFWVHLFQNYFALNYVNTIWTKCQKESWPSKISI
ncbi:MAG: coproporphyrinogen III oxidase family protein [Candidatus Omnitrophica bacterium]|jgi:oxygen-independent coproporphyrinogen-3 oxidase|nr:coproporphyrinogen III oxidase family protein [Candidatus Omnitrophota bacterium]